MTAAVEAGPVGAASPLPAVLAVLRADAPDQVYGAPEDWPRWADLLPHVTAAAGHQLGTREADTPAARDVACLLDHAATYHLVLGRRYDARPLVERGLTITQAAFGPDHPEVAAGLSNLALIRKALGQPAPSPSTRRPSGPPDAAGQPDPAGTAG